MNDIDFKQWLASFLKRPILVEQEAQIVSAMIDGTINKNGAKELFKYIIEQNIQKTHEFLSMSHEEIMELAS